MVDMVSLFNPTVYEGIPKFKNVSTITKWNTITFELFYSNSFRMVADVRKMYLHGK